MERIKGISFLVILLLLVGIRGASATGQQLSEYVREITYQEYITQHSGITRPQSELLLLGTDYSAADQQLATILLPGFPGEAIVTEEAGYVEWEISLDEPGLYNMAIYYYPLPGKGSSIERELWINGKRPFAGTRFLQFNRVWSDDGDLLVDVLGNQIRPRQIENPRWIEAPLTDSLGYTAEPYGFYLERGKNTVRLISRMEPMAIGYIKLYRYEEPQRYQDVLDRNLQAGYQKSADIVLKVQGQDSTARSASTLFAISDHGDPTVEPYHPAEIRLNSIGGHRWSQPGQWIAWEFEVPEDAYYKIGVKAKQQEIGTYSSRRVLLDGKVPFSELNAFAFPYSQGYQMYVLGEEPGKPYLFYLSKGAHELKMQVVLGNVNDILRITEESLYTLNTIYRRIIMITSNNPDPRRSYQLQHRIPDVIRAISKQAQVFEELVKSFVSTTGMEGGHTNILRQQAVLLERMAADPEVIPRVLGEYRDNIGAIGTWVFQTREQPLQIDYLVVASPDSPFPSATATIWDRLGHEARALKASFTHDYTVIGDLPDAQGAAKREPLTIWIGSGRDQAQIIKRMIDDTFRQETGIPVDLQLVLNMNQLLVQATVAGTGPDVAMGLNIPDPMNFGMRGALYNLKSFPDYETVIARFMPSALVPFTFRDRVFALPDQQHFPMMFYRVDILTELGLEVPQTWEDIYKMLPVLQRHNMSIGIGHNIFFTLLYQNGLPIYKADGVETFLDSETAIQVFRELTELFNLYDLLIQFNSENRFRMGEMPIVIEDYNLFNRLAVFAPELRGEWGFDLVPGTRMPDGTLNRTAAQAQSQATTVLQQQGRGGPGVAITANATDPMAAWEFLKWWTREDTQVRFGRELESVMGTAGRYPTSNVEAFKQLPWSVEAQEKLLAQWEWIEGNVEVPGSYYMMRMFEWAFRAVVINQEPVRETLMNYNRQINYELEIKRKEFGLETSLSHIPWEWQELYWEKFTLIGPPE